MSTQSADPTPERGLELSVQEVLRRARPLPPRDAMILEDLPEEEQEAFWAAINE
jgi:hypothetical protein